MCIQIRWRVRLHADLSGVQLRRQAGKKVRRSFKTISGAKRWRQDAAVAIRAGELTADRGPTLREATEQWLKAMEAGHEHTRSGDEYKPSAIRGYRQSLRRRVWPTLGRHRIGDVTARDVQALMDKLVRDGNAPATIDGALTPLRAFYRRSLVRGDVNRNPTIGVIKPAVRQKDQVIVPPAEVALRVALLEGPDRVLWTTAFYSGLRRGELIGLRVDDVDLDAGVIRVRRGWDMSDGEISTKSSRGRRDVPLSLTLRDPLANHVQSLDRAEIFESPRWVAGASKRAGKRGEAKGLARITLHDSRHTYASLMLAAGVRPDTLSEYMGHASYQTTVNMYRYLFPDESDKAADLLDAYLARSAGSTGAQTGAQEAQPA